MSDQYAGHGRVEVEHVWKKFHRGYRYDSLRDLIPALAGRLVTSSSDTDELDKNDFWALRDLSFSVKPGEALGIIGGNGAGKSTLLKVLTKILRPTRGHCLVQGRVGALIEIAAGFHPDLTGRENVFLQGAIMGMRRVEIERKFDQIVEFSGISEFIDTPVKRFSSGMNARLGFSIAAHLEPDVLIIDEVLAVGDFMFQAKAFDRIRQLVRQDIPVVVVSHQLDRVAQLCSQAILLDRGRVVVHGTPAECITAYTQGRAAEGIHDDPNSPLVLTGVTGPVDGKVTSGERVALTLRGLVKQDPTGWMSVGLRVRALHNGEVLFATGSRERSISLPESGEFEIETSLQLNVGPGIYAVETYVWDHRRGKEASAGPSLSLQVDGGPRFWGVVQMQPQMRMLSGGPAPVAGPA